MAVTLRDLVRETLDQMYSYVQVKDKFLYMTGDITDVATTFTVADHTAARGVQAGQVLQFSDATLEHELLRVKAVDLTTFIVTVVRGVLGTTARAWTAADTTISMEPEYPINTVIREINNVVTGLAPDLFAIKQTFTSVSNVLTGYALPNGAVGVVGVSYLPSGPEGSWAQVRRYRFDPVNKQVDVFALMEPGRDLLIIYRQYPDEFFTLDDQLDQDVGLPDSCKQLIVWGALYQLLIGRTSGRLVDTRAETPMNQQYRQADPVLTAARQLFAMYKQRLVTERERQRHEWPLRPYYTF